VTADGTPRLEVTPAALEAILELREEYRREMDCQIVHDSWHARGFVTSHLLRVGGEVVGHGAVGGPPGEARDVVKELFVRAPWRRHSLGLLRTLVATSGARWIEAQTNDRLLSLLLYDCTVDWTSDTILFADARATAHPAPTGAVVRRMTADDRGRVFEHTLEPVGEWGLELEGRIVATGGVLTHYNPPWGDLFMEVDGTHRLCGLGSYLVQELKRICREGGRTPAARCRQENVASRRTLERAGMLPCARIVRGRIAATRG
jgi:GNAT superfamily N-acetyltransferase